MVALQFVGAGERRRLIFAEKALDDVSAPHTEDIGHASVTTTPLDRSSARVYPAGSSRTSGTAESPTMAPTVQQVTQVRRSEYSGDSMEAG